MIKMSKILAAVAVFVTITLTLGICLTGCQVSTEENTSEIVLEVVSKEPVAAKYEPPHYDTATTYEYQWDWWNGEYKLLPVVNSEYVEEKFNVQYEIIYSDGSKDYVWESVPEVLYYEILSSMLPPNNITEKTTE